MIEVRLATVAFRRCFGVEIRMDEQEERHGGMYNGYDRFIKQHADEAAYADQQSIVSDERAEMLGRVVKGRRNRLCHSCLPVGSVGKSR